MRAATITQKHCNRTRWHVQLQNKHCFYIKYKFHFIMYYSCTINYIKLLLNQAHLRAHKHQPQALTPPLTYLVPLCKHSHILAFSLHFRIVTSHYMPQIYVIHRVCWQSIKPLSWNMLFVQNCTVQLKQIAHTHECVSVIIHQIAI